VIPEGWNNTTIVLVPKVENPEPITQFHPISLCNNNTVYKVVSKLIANRQKKSTPIKLITDNIHTTILVAYESYYTIKNKSLGKYGTCMVKLDMHKAHDRVEWRFLEKILVLLGSYYGVCFFGEIPSLDG
jgi:hypothetical protein